ncbi:hypothetical protein ACLOJK_005918, partial [Asimina triloba]
MRLPTPSDVAIIPPAVLMAPEAWVEKGAVLLVGLERHKLGRRRRSVVGLKRHWLERGEAGRVQW